jgi:fructokinase
MAGLLSAIVDHGLDGAQNRGALRAMPAETLASVMDHATRAAAITVSRAGANPPTRAELNHGTAAGKVG